MKSRYRVRLLAFPLGFALLVLIMAALPLTPATQPAMKEQHKKVKMPYRQAQRKVPAIQSNVKSAAKSTTEFENPPELPLKDGKCELRLAKDTFNIAGGPFEDSTKAFELLCYNNQPVGPTIRIGRGAKFGINLKNNLQGKPDPGPNPNDPLTSEQPHGLCTTNLHTHGLHVSPADNADNVFLAVEPGAQFSYDYGTIRDDHPSGTFWYHPHKHGSVAYQLSNGLAGALIVEGDKNTDLDQIPEIKAAREKIMVLQLYTYRTDNFGTGRIDAVGFEGNGGIYNVMPNSVSCDDIPVVGSVTGQVAAINGQIVPIIRMLPCEVQRWRIIHGSWDELKALTFADTNGVNTTDIQFREIAQDGLATGKMEIPPDNHLELAPGQRSDVLIQAPKVAKTYFLKQDELPPEKSLRGDDVKASYLAMIVVADDPKDKAKVVKEKGKVATDLPDPNGPICKCRPFEPVKKTMDPPDAFAAGLLFNGIDLNQTYNINFRTFHRYDTPIPITLGATQEWTIKAARSVTNLYEPDPDPSKNLNANNHPFHIHVNPFQVIQKKDAKGKVTNLEDKNIWRDTLFVRGGDEYTIRMTFKDFTGQTVLHCHILDHEDQGMMVPLLIVDPAKAQPGAEKKAEAKLKKSSAPASALKLLDARGGMRDLADLRGREVLLVFFQGAECSHCVEQIRGLLRDARAANAPGAEIMAVSSRQIGSLPKALEVLGASPLDKKFHLVVDQNHQAFRDFGCFDTGPMHGLFLIDKVGIIRYRYVGETPFDDTKAAVECLRKLSISSDN
jgi:FtsP/CotA-like multicopper oxidase with cupredoxin domain/peroxiredoxin